MAESRVQVNVPLTAGKNLKTFETVDGDGFLVESEAVTLVAADGSVIAPATETTLTQIAISVEVLGSLLPGAEHTITSALAVMILPANPLRRGTILQNNGAGNVRVGPVGVTASPPNGLRLLPDAIVTASPPFLPIDALWAIAEDVSSAVFVTEIV